MFDKDIVEELKSTFTFSKIESNKLTYCGSQITVNDDGSIELNQDQYIDSLREISEIDVKEDRKLTEKEKRLVRGKIGELLWISLISRPDLSFEVNLVSSQIADGSVSLAKTVNNIIRNAQSVKNVLKFSKLGDLSELSVKVHADASFCNAESKTRSTEGRVIMLSNERTGFANVCSWKTKKISRVCRSVKAAETRALEEALDDAVNTARMIKEIYSGKINLKSPDQIPIKAFTDSKSLWENLHNTRQCEEKMLRCSIAAMKELLELGMVVGVCWVSTNDQLADCLTKKGKRAEGILKLLSNNK